VIYYAPVFKDPNYIHLNKREHDRINPYKQQGINCIGTGFCNICGRELKYFNQQLCHVCRNHLIRGELFGEYGELTVLESDNHRQYDYLVNDNLVSQINYVMNRNFKSRTYKNKTAKMICVMMKYLEAKGNIEPDVAYRRLRYYALTERRDSLQKTLQTGKKLFRILFRSFYK